MPKLLQTSVGTEYQSWGLIWAISFSSFPWCSKNFKPLPSLWVCFWQNSRARTELPLFAIHGFCQQYHLLHFSSWTQVEIYWALYFGFSSFSFIPKLENKIILLLEGSCAKSLPRATGFYRHRKVGQFLPRTTRAASYRGARTFPPSGCLLCRVMWDLLANSSLKNPSIPSPPELSCL